jgi:hypothetical protein
MCNICTSWAYHYVEYVLNDTPSLRDAELVHDTTIIGGLCKALDSLTADNAALIKQLSGQTSTLDKCNIQKEKVQHTLLEKTAQVSALHEQLSNLQEDQLCKIPRQGSSPSNCTRSELPMDDDCNISHPSSAPLQLLSRIDLPDVLTNDKPQASALNPGAPQFSF